MKHILLITISILYFTFQVINLDTIEDTNINYRAVAENFISSETVDKINSIASNDYKTKLYAEADFNPDAGITTGKEGFKKPYLFMLFLKDNAIIALKIITLLVLSFIAFKIFVSILRAGKSNKQSSKLIS